VPTETKALSSIGWAVRYDYKAGAFAEMRGDFDIARRYVLSHFLTVETAGSRLFFAQRL
jgi:hypothetical protein